eukprot:CAMPEP_0181185250 /NCGR_PEP_ID=MMETSP1096-20121128/9405_1 /TAXON_ID=156174 ORGANISM="Chrysochromulina ericina, Strain CCMP281" /NCGR_SAMPLE_ID=MMETSP1096 /ASSEMBLY_ACC=CAM_ASM_000453 /LENGTH=100 /DNA_ID=CAMNT_0023274077 /DNA_START=613 /DNA_END=911 /DNA_ORIENTATION=-
MLSAKAGTEIDRLADLADEPHGADGEYPDGQAATELSQEGAALSRPFGRGDAIACNRDREREQARAAEDVQVGAARRPVLLARVALLEVCRDERLKTAEA